MVVLLRSPRLCARVHAGNRQRESACGRVRPLGCNSSRPEHSRVTVLAALRSKHAAAGAADRGSGAASRRGANIRCRTAGQEESRGVAREEKPPSPGGEPGVAGAALVVAAAFIFGAGVYAMKGPDSASEFFAGYLLEQSLSVDNLFVFVLLFSYFQVPKAYEAKVLEYGILGAAGLRAAFIGASPQLHTCVAPA
jgi:Integral membrane protein TerC family